MSAIEEYEEHARNMRFGAGHFSTVSRERADAMRDELLAENERLRVCGNCDHNGGSRCCEPAFMQEEDNVILVGGGRARCRFIVSDGVSRWTRGLTL